MADEVLRIVGDNPVYLTFDIDCLDPSCAPGTGTPVCGGLSTHQALEIVRGIAGVNLVGMDVVEVAPAYDVGEITALAGAVITSYSIHYTKLYEPCIHVAGCYLPVSRYWPPRNASSLMPIS